MKYPIFLMLYMLILSCDKENVKAQGPDLLGAWELVGYEDKNDDTFETAPESERPVSIKFMETTFEGSTGNNVFFGDYSTTLGQLVLIGGGITEVNDTEWGRKFYYERLILTFDSENNTFTIPYTINEDTLKLEYDKSQFMIFIKR